MPQLPQTSGGGVDNEVPQLHAILSELLDYFHIIVDFTLSTRAPNLFQLQADFYVNFACVYPSISPSFNSLTFTNIYDLSVYIPV